MTIFVNEREVQFGTYPNGEVIVPDIGQIRENGVTVRLHWSGDEDLLRLALVHGLIQQSPRFTHKRLWIDYMPYSRMDREQAGACFSLKYVAQVINTMHWDRVYVVEPHSQVTLDLLQRSEPVWATARLTPTAMDWMGFDSRRDYLVLPDAGAFARYSDQIAELPECNVIVLKKKRDFATGKIQGLEIGHRMLPGSSDVPLGGKALILDDLCSRGGTFVQAADLLRFHLGISHVALLVTHMEPAGLLGDLRHRLDRVFCTDSMTFPRPVPDNFEIFNRSHWT